jgi:hypothetical protein
MEAAEASILESTKQISRLYHDHIDVKKAVKLMRDQNISAEFVKSTYNQLSWNAEKSTMDRFRYYTVLRDKNSYEYTVDYWTSRYLFAYRNSDFHKIKVIDVFNNKSM